MSGVPNGKMRLFSLARPVWRPGTHFLWLNQKVTAPGDATPLVKSAGGQQTEFVFQVTGPRTALTPAEVQGCFPVPTAREAPDTCLPHIVLRRRTLPWERVLTSQNVDPSTHPPPDTPWMALLLVPADQVELEAAPLSQVFSPARLLELHLDGKLICDQLKLTRGLLRAVMPRKQDLALLTHVRQLSLADREAKGDDDGFLALVMANRLPTAGQKHLACLVSLEGRWDEDIWPKGQVYDPTDTLAVRMVALHAWEFTAGSGGDFEAIMQGLGQGHVQRFAAAGTVGAGFVALEHTDREGVKGTALYRGPLTPVALARDLEVAASADSALLLTPEGTPVISHAAAFELGRLLTQASDNAMTALQEFRGHTYASQVGRFLVEDHFASLAKQLNPNIPQAPEEIFSSLWEAAPVLNLQQIQAFASDPSGIAHLMETVPGLTWSQLGKYKPDMLELEFSTARSIAAHQQLGNPVVVSGNLGLPAIDLGGLSLGDLDLGITLDAGLGHLMTLADGALEDVQEGP